MVGRALGSCEKWQGKELDQGHLKAGLRAFVSWLDGGGEERRKGD